MLHLLAVTLGVWHCTSPGPLGAQTCVPPPAGLAAWWPGDGNSSDPIGANHGAAGSAVSYVPGKVGGACRFTDSSDSFVQLPNAPVFQPANNQLTIAAWVRSDFSGTLNSLDHILAKRDGCGGEPYSFSFGIVKGYVGYPTGSFGLGMLPQMPWIGSTNRIPDDGQFHHLAVTYNGDKTSGNCVLYLDGQIVGGGDGPGPIPVTASGPTMGRVGSCPLNSKMDLDELAFFDRELSPADIQAMFAAGSAGLCQPQCVPPPSDLVGWWPGDGHFFDLAGTNHGVPFGNVTFVPAEVGRGFRFDGASSAIFIPPSPAADVGAQAGFTVQAWLQPAGNRHIMWFSWATEGEGRYGPYGYLMADNSAYFNVVDTLGNGNVIQTPPNTVVPGEMQQLALTYDKASGSAAIYRNGQVVVSKSLGTFTPATAGAQIVLGRQPPAWAYEGALDELALFKRALSASEIAANYAAHGAGMCKPCIPPPAGVVSWWSGDRHPMDLTGTNHGQLHGGLGYAAGEVGPAFSLDGTNDYVRIPDSPSLQQPDAPFAISAWFRTDDAARNQILLSKGLSDANEEYSINLQDDGSIYWDYGDASSGWCRTVVGLLTAVQWHHLVTLYDPSANPKGRIFLDGVERVIENGGSGGHVVSSGSPLYLGTQNAGAFYYGGRKSFQGQLDEVAIFNRLLTPGEIALLHGSGTAGQCKELKLLVSPLTNAVAYLGVSSAPLSVVASGTRTLTYQWLRDGANLPGQTNAALTLPNPQFTNAGSYTVVVADATGASLTSAPPAALAVKLCEAPPAGLVGWWPGDGHGFDLAANKELTLPENNSFGPGVVGQGFHFQDRYALIPGPFSFAANNSFTFATWFRIDALNGRWQGLFCSFNDYAYRLMVSADTRLYYNAGTQSDQSVGPVLATNRFYHAALVITGGATARVYLDGQLISDRVEGVPAVLPDVEGFYLGGEPPWQWNMPDGILDEPALFNRALSAGEVAGLYAAGGAGMCKDLRILALPAANAVAYLGVSNAPFSVVVSGTGTLAYQWQRNGANVPGQTNATLALANPQLTDTGLYTVALGDATGAALTSAPPVTLTVKVAADVPPGLLGWWPGDGHGLDLSTNHNDGTLQGGAGYAPGEVGPAFSFTGTNAFVAAGTSDLFNFDHGNGDFSLEAWIKPAAFAFCNGIVSKAESSAAGWAFYYYADGRLGFGGAGVWEFTTAAGVVRPGTWSHVAVVRTGSDYRLYHNGIQTAATTHGGLLETSTAPLRLGTSWYWWMQGALDEVAIYNRGLSTNELASHYAASSAGMSKELQFIADLQPTNQTRGVTGQASFTALVSGSGPLSYVWRQNGLPVATNGSGSLVLSNLSLTAAGSYDVVVSDLNLVSATSRVAVLNLVDRYPRYGCLAGGWPGEGNANDALGLNDGTLQGGVSFTNGMVEQAFAFNGADAYVEVPNCIRSVSNFTFSFWLNVRSYTHLDYMSPLCQWDPPYGPGFAFYCGSGTDTFGFHAADGSQFMDLRTNGGPVPGVWTHVAVTYDGMTAKQFVNGVLQNQVPLLGFVLGNDRPLLIGKGYAYPASGSVTTYFDGRVDELSFFGCALSSKQVAALYNTPPGLPAQPERVIAEMATLVVTNTATDSGLPFNGLTYTLLAGPTNATINTNTGVITWTPLEAQGPSSNRFVTLVTDNGLPPLSDTNSFSVLVSEVNLPPALTVPTNQVIAELSTLTVTNVATDADMPTNLLTFQLLAGPTNAVCHTNTGVFTWTPTEAQGPSSNWITLRVFDNGIPSLSTTGSFAVVVLEVNVAPVLPTNLPPQTVLEGQLLTVSRAATDADLPTNQLTYSLVGPPAGASVDSNGVVTWTPAHAQAGSTYTLRVKVTDNGTPSLSATNSLTVQVKFLNRPPVLDPIADQAVDELKLLQFTAAASDPDAGQTLTFTLGGSPPAGAAIAPASGVFTWTPTEAQGPGVYLITLVVTDNGSAFGASNLATNRTFTVTVREVNRPPLLGYLPDLTVPAGQAVSLRASATDPDVPTNTLAYSLDVFALVPPEPTNATLNAATGAFTWRTTEADLGNEVLFVVTVTDNGVPPLASARSFLVTVVAPTHITVAINQTPSAKLRLTWNSTAGRRYQVRHRASLGETTWSNLGSPVTATGSTTEFTDESLGTAPWRFYQVEELAGP
jgi:hypothetical protein